MRTLAIPLFVLISCNSSDPVEPEPPDTTTATSTVFAQQAMDEFVTAVAENIAETGVPGASLAVLYDGQIYTANLGLRSVDGPELIDDDTLFNYASMTKMLTAAAVLTVADDDQIDLDANLTELLPGIQMDHGYEDRTNLRLLMNHSAGLSPLLGMNCSHPNETLEEWVIRAQPWEVWVEPGTLWSYSNAGYSLVGRSVEIATGQGIEDVVRQHTFEPAGMSRTSYTIPGPTENRAYGHRGDPWTPTDDSIIDCVSTRIGGGIWGTSGDLIRFAQATLDGSLPSLDTFVTDTVYTGRGPDMDYGFGLFEEPYRGLYTLSHGGSVSGFGGAITIVPDQGFAVVALLNGFTVAGDPFKLNHVAIDLFLNPEEDVRSLAVDPAIWPEWEGLYLGESGGPLTAEVVGDEMKVTIGATSFSQVMPYDNGETFRVSEDGLQRVTFWLDETGAPVWMSTPWGVGRRTVP